MDRVAVLTELPLGSGSQYAIAVRHADVTAEGQLVKGRIQMGFLEEVALQLIQNPMKVGSVPLWARAVLALSMC